MVREGGGRGPGKGTPAYGDTRSTRARLPAHPSGPAVPLGATAAAATRKKPDTKLPMRFYCEILNLEKKYKMVTVRRVQVQYFNSPSRRTGSLQEASADQNIRERCGIHRPLTLTKPQ